MTILEQQSIGKRGAEANEDLLLVTPHFAAAIDGSTSKSTLPLPPEGVSGGKKAALLCANVLRHVAADIPLSELCQRLEESLHNAFVADYGEEMLPRLSAHPEDRYACSAIVYSAYYQEVWLIGDCHGLLLHADGSSTYMSNEKPYEQPLALQRSAFLRSALADGLTIDEVRRHDTGRDHILPLLLQSMQGAGSDYAVIDGFPIPLDKVKTYDAADAQALVLATDGYPQLFPTLAETESHLQECLHDDPLMLTIHPATKGWMQGNDSFDDRSFLKITKN